MMSFFSDSFFPTSVNKPAAARKIIAGLVFGLMLAGLVISQPLAPAQAAPARPVEILVKFRAATPSQAVEQFAASHGGQRRAEIGPLGVQVLRFPAGVNQSALIARLQNNPLVSYAEPNATVTATFLPNDPGYSNQWGLDTIQAPPGWDVQPGSSNVIIAIVDSGVDPDHPDLQGKRVIGWNYDMTSPNYSTALTNDDNGHGTHVAGIAAASVNNGIGVAGVCPNCSFMPVKVLGADGNGTYDAVALGIIHAADYGAQIINLSLSGTAPSQTLQNAVTYAANKGVLVVAAAGNDGSNQTHYPAAYSGVMAVAATDSTDWRASFSSYNSYISVAAPGVSIYSTAWSPTAGSTYAYLSGTSMSTPLVAGLAGLLLAQDNTRTPATLRTMIEKSAQDIDQPGWDQYTGYGRINVVRALTGAISGTVSDALTGVRLANAQVVALQNSQTVATTFSASDGSYYFANLRPGSYEVRVSLQGYIAQARQGVSSVASVVTGNVNFSLAPAGAIAGQITYNRKAVPGALVEAVQGGQVVGQAVSDANGNYQIGNLAAATYSVQVSASGYRSQSRTGVVVNAGQTTTGVNFQLKR